MKKRGTQEALIKRADTLYPLETRINLLATNLFSWEGLPKSIPEHFIEKSLFHEGKIALYNDKGVGMVATKCASGGETNIYGEPTQYELTGGNGYTKFVDAKEIVIIRNNNLEVPTYQLIYKYIEKLYTIERIIDTNIRQQRITKILCGDESQRGTIENILLNHDLDVPYITGNSKSLQGIQTFAMDLSSPFIADKLLEIRNIEWGNMLEVLGINNANTDKRERMIVDEVNANNDIIGLSSFVFLHARERACEEINEKFGLNVTVERRNFDGDLHSRIGGTDRE